ncbi:MAG TPA: hypothetical protein VM577_18500 [Anaerovoracaceae bacterium]|nr:hypothetical protein [Anaerovoracaceae bacterium]
METLFELSFEDEFRQAVGHVVQTIIVQDKAREKNVAWGKLKKLFPEGRQKRVENFHALTEEAMFDIVTASLAVGQTELVESYVKGGATNLKQRIEFMFTAKNLLCDLRLVIGKHDIKVALKDVVNFYGIEEAHNRLKQKGLLEKDHSFGWAAVVSLTF